MKSRAILQSKPHSLTRYHLTTLFYITISLSLIAILFSPPATAKSVVAAVHKEGKYPTYPTIDYGTGKQAELIKKGEELVKVGDCIACHTNTQEGGKPFAGGLPIVTKKYGTIYTPNITPDKETGIGAWTDKEFIHAMRDGVSPTGVHYYPAFPYLYFNRVTTEDLLAIRAYLNAIPPVYQKDRKNKLNFPYNIKLGMVFWDWVFFDPYKGQFKPDPNKSALWNRGKYLVDGLGHCAMCHTPMNFLGAPKRKYDLTGAMVEGYYAPNITSTLLKNVKVAEIERVFLKDRLVGGRGEVTGPMLEVNHDSLSHISAYDREAIATYLKTVKSKQPPAPKVSKGAGPGKAVFEAHCAVCHKTGAAGAPIVGNVKDWAPRIKLGLNVLYRHAIHGIGAMPAKGTCMTCTDTQIHEAVQYMVDQSKPGATGAQRGVPKGEAPPTPTAAHGKVIYDRVCSVCHETGKLGAQPLTREAWEPILQRSTMDVLFERSIKGYKGMPPMGACYECTDGDIISAVKYMVEKAGVSGNYSLW